ncbi:MAG: GAF domain-containing protein, partial [Cytophagales bacterium]|nr:GAF domain-containing protein [Cytophagales bacterium]
LEPTIAHALSDVRGYISTTAKYIEEMGQNVADVDIQVLGEQDLLRKNLKSMQENIIRLAEKENERKWIAEGLAKFNNYLLSNEEVKTLCDTLISELVKYLKANQGAIFLINDENQQDIHMNLVSCYAYDRKKYLEKRIEIGEGLVGQAVLERESIYLTQVPKDYIEITSGLGQALPNCVFIVPLKINDKIEGVIELATFKPFVQFEKEFVEKFAENFASVISATKINEKSKILLKELHQQQDNMRQTEEQLRQNNEELIATQEEMKRQQNELMELKKNLEEEVLKQTSELRAQKEEMEKNHEDLVQSQAEAIKKEKQLIAILNATPDAIFTATQDGKIMLCNEAISEFTGYGMKEIIGVNVKELFGEEKLPYRKSIKTQVKKKNGEYLPVILIINKTQIDGTIGNLYLMRESVIEQQLQS